MSIAEDIIEGILCEGCGCYIDDRWQGVPRKCNSCKPDTSKARAKAIRKVQRRRGRLKDNKPNKR